MPDPKNDTQHHGTTCSAIWHDTPITIAVLSGPTPLLNTLSVDLLINAGHLGSHLSINPAAARDLAQRLNLAADACAELGMAISLGIINGGAEAAAVSPAPTCEVA